MDLSAAAVKGWTQVKQLPVSILDILEIILKIISISEAKTQAENGVGYTIQAIWTANQIFI